MPTVGVERLQEFETPQNGQTLIARRTTQQWTGPLPPPDAIEAFESVVPGAGMMILEEFRSEAAHRRAMERQQGNLIVRETHIGQFLAIVFALAALAVAVYAASVGATWIGSIVGGGVIVSGMVALLGSRRSAPDALETADSDEAPRSKQPTKARE